MRYNSRYIIMKEILKLLKNEKNDKKDEKNVYAKKKV